MEVNVQITGFVAHVESHLIYENTESNAVETFFSFPLDESAAVFKFKAEISGRNISAVCQDKAQVMQKTKLFLMKC